MSDLEKERIELDRERLEFEKQNAKRESSITTKHLGVIITAIVSLAAVLVSGAQVWVAHETKDRDIALAEIEAKQRWNLDTAQFFVKHQEAIFSGTQTERIRIRNLMLVLFPRDVTAPLFDDLKEVVPEDEKPLWQEARIITAESAASNNQGEIKIGQSLTILPNNAVGSRLLHEIREAPSNILAVVFGASENARRVASRISIRTDAYPWRYSVWIKVPFEAQAVLSEEQIFFGPDGEGVLFFNLEGKPSAWYKFESIASLMDVEMALLNQESDKK